MRVTPHRKPWKPDPILVPLAQENRASLWDLYEGIVRPFSELLCRMEGGVAVCLSFEPSELGIKIDVAWLMQQLGKAEDDRDFVGHPCTGSPLMVLAHPGV